MTATLTQTILAVDGVRSPMLQAGPPPATEAVVFVHDNPGSSQDWARLVERTGDQPGTALDAVRPRPRPTRHGDSTQAGTNWSTTVSLIGTSGSQPVIRQIGSVTPCPSCQPSRARLRVVDGSPGLLF